MDDLGEVSEATQFAPAFFGALPERVHHVQHAVTAETAHGAFGPVPDWREGTPTAEPDRLVGVFCLRDKRYVTKDLTLKYDRKRIRLEVNDLTRGLVGKYVDVYEMPDGRIQVRAKGVALPFSILDPHQQRVTHAAITENKHLSAVLAHIKKEQEKAASPPKVKPVSAKNNYKKNGRRNTGWNSLAAQKRIADRKASQGCDS